jgi:glutaminyl-peptide cyclotransferase
MPTLEGFVGAVDSAVPCALLLNLATTMTELLNELESAEPDLTVALIFFDGEEAMDYWTSADSLYGSKKMAAEWANNNYNVFLG